MGILDETSCEPPDIDFENAQIAVFNYTGKKHMPSASIVIYDDSNFFDVIEKPKIQELVQRGELAGVVVETDQIKDLLTLLMDSYMHIRMGVMVSEKDSLTLANRIHEKLTDIGVF